MSSLLFLALVAAIIPVSCRPSHPCGTFEELDAIAAAEVPSFLAEDWECWTDGPCPSRRFNQTDVEGYLGEVDPIFVDQADRIASVYRDMYPIVSDYHRKCNQEVRSDFVRSMTAGNFKPPINANAIHKAWLFLSSPVGQGLVSSREALSPTAAAKPYELNLERASPNYRKARLALQKFLGSAAGMWWKQARQAAWNAVLERGATPRELCSQASNTFAMTRTGLLVSNNLTSPIEFGGFLRGRQ